MSSAEAGPSRPRKQSASSLTSPSKTKFRDSNERVNMYASTSTSRPANSYDPEDGTAPPGRHSMSDEEDLPGYSAPSMGGQGDYRDIEGKGADRHQEPLLANTVTSSRRMSETHSTPSIAPSATMSIAQRKARWWRSTLITGMFVASWYGFATLLSIYNKWMFSAEYYNFPYPLFVTACHMVVQFAIASLIRFSMPDRFRPPEKPTRRDYAGKILPTAISTAGDIGLSNLSLRTITLSLYTMCKSSALIFVLIFAFLFRLERYSLRLLSVISLISVGVFFMVYDTTAVNIPGIVMVFSASALAGLRWALTETLMKKQHMGMSNPFATIFWLAPLMGLVLAPVSLGVEGWGNVFGSGHWDGLWQAMGTALVIIFPGGLAFAMVASEYFIIDRAGILPLSIAGVFKEVSTISMSAWVFGDQLTQLNIVGVVIAVCGIALYSFHKYQKSMSDPDDHGHTPARAYLLAASDERSATPHTYPPGTPPSPIKEPESSQDRVDRLRDDFEGWNDPQEGDVTDSESEVGEDEIVKRREERIHTKGKWAAWWDREM